MAESKAPTYCHHRPTGQAFLTVNDGGKRSTRYLGRWASPKSLTAYRDALTESGFAARVVEKALRTANHKIVAAQATLGTTSYGHAVAVCCKKAGVPRFGTNRIRHTVGEEVRRTHGLDHVQALLGHKTRQSSERYAPVVKELAVVVANARG